MMRRNIKRTTKTSGRRMNISKVLTGGQIRVGADPPSFVQRPWNNLMVRWESTAASTAINPLDVQLLLEQQLSGVSTPSVLTYDLRIREARAWGSTDESDRLWVDFYDLQGVGDDPLSQLTDFPGKNTRAKLGYKWPVSSQNVVLSTTETKDIIRGNFDVLYLNVLWRLKFVAPPAGEAEHPSAAFVAAKSEK
jgi:hypothetical protein